MKRELLLAEVLLRLDGMGDLESRTVLSAHSIDEYLNSNISQPTDLGTMSEHFSVSKSTLCRLGKQLCGVTIQRKHESMKIEWAKVLLGSGAFSVSEVANRVGYSDALYFSRVFHRRVGVRPSKWVDCQK